MPDTDITRRTLIAGLPLAAILADPRLARAAAETTNTMRITTAGGQTVAAALAHPANTPAPAVMLVHEWWGLNDQIKATAVELSRQGYLALAIDLFHGRVATEPDEARALTEKVKPEEADDTLSSWLQWLANHQDSSRKVGTLGWCFGGGWALRAATLVPADATVVYYGKVDLPAEQLARLKGPVLGHFARRDQFVTANVVADFERAMKKAGKPYTIHWYDAGHAFANPTGDNFSKPDAQLAWKRTLAFFGEQLR